MALVNAQNLSLGYDGKVVASGVSFEVNRGDYLCIVGENGSGKSTLMKTILGLLSPLSGNISFGEGLASHEIGYLPQQTIVQKDFPASVREIVLSGCLNRIGLRPFYGKAEKERAAEAMDRLNIRSLEKVCYRELSGGQQQRVLLARAYCATQKLLLLDEPTAGLDPQATQDMYQMIAELNETDTITVIMISHDIASAVQYASHILHVGNHQTLFFGTKEQYLTSEFNACPICSTEAEQGKMRSAAKRAVPEDDEVTNRGASLDSKERD